MTHLTFRSAGQEILERDDFARGHCASLKYGNKLTTAWVSCPWLSHIMFAHVWAVAMARKKCYLLHRYVSTTLLILHPQLVRAPCRTTQSIKSR